jgi:HK97 family phage prohead protease
MMGEFRTMKVAEYRATELEDGHGLTVQAINTKTVDDYGSLWDARAFDEHLEQAMPRLVWAHDWSEPLGPPVSFERSSKGPIVTFRFSDFDAVPMAKRAHAQVKDGTLTDVSVGFRYLDGGTRAPTKAEAERYPGIREVITRAAMDEVSLVLRGAVPGAKVLAVREAQELELAEQIMETPRMTARLRSGETVDLEAVFEIARQKAAGTLSAEAAGEALSLLASLDAGPTPAPPEPEPVPPPPHAPDMDAELLALETMTEA